MKAKSLTLLTALLLFLLLALPGTVRAAVSVNTASGPSGWVTGNGANTLTFSPAFSFTPGANGMLMVTVSGEVTPRQPHRYLQWHGPDHRRIHQSDWHWQWQLRQRLVSANPSVGNGALVVTAGGSVSRYNVYAV